MLILVDQREMEEMLLQVLVRAVEVAVLVAAAAAMVQREYLSSVFPMPNFNPQFQCRSPLDLSPSTPAAIS